MAVSDRFFVIDFETANAQRISACSVGVAVIDNCEVKESFSTLIRPPELDFAPINIRIHGITPDMVKEAPTFDKVFPRLHELADGCPIVGYSSFDKSVIAHLSRHYRLPVPNKRLEEYIDVCHMAKGKLPQLKNHKLKTVAKHFNLGNFKHHDAVEDAIMCARVFLELDKLSPPSIKPPITNPISIAFNSFISSITDDNKIDYKEAVELYYFLQTIPQNGIIRQLMTVVEDTLRDGEIDDRESAVLIRLANLVNERLANSSSC